MLLLQLKPLQLLFFSLSHLLIFLPLTEWQGLLLTLSIRAETYPPTYSIYYLINWGEPIKLGEFTLLNIASHFNPFFLVSEALLI